MLIAYLKHCLESEAQSDRWRSCWCFWLAVMTLTTEACPMSQKMSRLLNELAGALLGSLEVRE